jgi:hypothetical protein
MKKFLIVLSLVTALSAGAKESYYPDEIHGTNGLINNVAVNSWGAMLILDDRNKSMSILLRERTQVGPLYNIKDGKKTVNQNAFVPKKITSNRWSFKSFGPSPQVFVNIKGYVSIRKEGMSSSYEILMLNGADSDDKKVFDEIWNWYITSPRMVIEIEIDGNPVQLNFVR